MKNTQPVTSPRWKPTSQPWKLLVGLSLVLSLSACGLLPWGADETAPPKPPGNATADLAGQALESAPALVDSVTGLISTIALTLILLSLAFKRSRSAISGMLTALADAMTYRINQWKVKRDKKLEESDGAE